VICGKLFARGESKIFVISIVPHLYVIAGCNGAGKTTASFTMLPEMLDCKEFVNADEIARGLSPFQPETVSFEAGRIMLTRISDLLSERADFAFETTLSTKSYRPLIVKAQKLGYKVVIIFFWLESKELAKTRVQSRVKLGGHSIPDDVIERRYIRGLDNFFTMYRPICDAWLFCNNSGQDASIVARSEDSGVVVENADIWEMLMAHYG
jgi:predicted ABC-type ATPase